MTSAVARSIVEYLHQEPQPVDWQLSFVAAICLALASTIFAVCCPPRVKEFSSEQWQYEFDKQLPHYMALAWRYRFIRIICIVLYAVGGFVGLYLLLKKIAQTFYLMFAISSDLLT